MKSVAMNYNKDLIQELFLKCRSGGESKFEELWKECRYLINLNKYFDRTGLNTKEDLELVAMVGLYKALKAYDVNRSEAKFVTFAYECMVNEVMTEVSKHKRSRIESKGIRTEVDKRFLEQLMTVDAEMGSGIQLWFEISIRKELQRNGKEIMVKIFDRKLVGEENSQIAVGLGLKISQVQHYIRRIRGFAEQVISNICGTEGYLVLSKM